MRFAKNVFRVAGVWGVLVVTPLYFMYDRIGALYPPAITHPDFYYAFVGVALAWQVAFLVIATDPVRFRPIMLAAVLEKLGFVFTLAALYAQGRLDSGQMAIAGPDLVLGILFIVAFYKTSGVRPHRDPQKSMSLK